MHARLASYLPIDFVFLRAVLYANREVAAVVETPQQRDPFHEVRANFKGASLWRLRLNARDVEHALAPD